LSVCGIEDGVALDLEAGQEELGQPTVIFDHQD
jgi:hypothetical protein